MWRQLHPNIKVRIINSFLTRMVGGAIFPFMAVYFAHYLGAGLAGLLLMALVAVQFVAGLYGGGLADAWGRRRTLLAGEVLKLLAFAALLLGNLWTPLPWVTFAALAVINVANGLINPAAEAMLVDVSTPDTRTFMYAVNYWAVNASLLLGTLLGGWLYQDHFAALLAGLLGMSFVTLFLAWRFMTETLGGPRRTAAQVRESVGVRPLLRSYAQVMTDRPYVLFTLGFVFLMTIEFGRQNFIPVHLAQSFPAQALWGVNLTGIKVMSLVTAINTLLIVVLTIPVSHWVGKRELRPVMALGFLLFAVGFAALYGSLNLWALVAGSVVLSIGELLYVPARQTLLADLIPQEKRGAYLAVNGQVFTLAKWLATLGVPLGAQIGGLGMGALIALLGVLAVVLSLRSLREASPERTPEHPAPTF